MRFLIVKTSSLGDIIHAFPVAAYLREKFPEAVIDWVAEAPFAELVESHPAINTVYRIATREWRKGRGLGAFKQFISVIRKVPYDILFDFQGNTKSGIITAIARAKKKVGFGRNTVAEWPNLLATSVRFDPPLGLNIRQENLYLAQSAFSDSAPFQESGVRLQITPKQEEHINLILSNNLFSHRQKIMVCSGSAWPNKQMTTSALTQFLKGFHDAAFLFIWGNDQEKITATELHSSFAQNSVIIERLSLPVLQNLMDKMDLVISMDSLPLHLAATTAAPTYGIFGASAAAKYAPSGPNHRSFQGSCPYGQTFVKRCPLLRSCKTGACIRDLTGEEL